jgi:hypothetical protein
MICPTGYIAVKALLAWSMAHRQWSHVVMCQNEQTGMGKVINIDTRREVNIGLVKIGTRRFWDIENEDYSQESEP